VRLLKLHNYLDVYGATLQLCVLSSNNFGGCALLSFIGVEVLLLVLCVGRSFNSSGLCGFVYIIPVTICNGCFMYISI
jgi:hypothetical protein